MRVKLTIGDWSDDGHGKSKEIIYESNKSIEEIQQAYKDSCKLTGLQFNTNQDYTELGLRWDHPEYDARHIATDYEDNVISKLAEATLLKHGIDVWDGFDMKHFNKETDLVHIDGPQHFCDLLIKFIKLSLPDLELEEIPNSIMSINGWWNENLNVQFGYGLFN